MHSLPSRRCFRTLLAAVLLGGPVAPATALSAHDSSSPVPDAVAQAGDSVDVARTVRRFHDALAAGDSAAALSLLAPDVTILESGDVETREEYRAHHLAADIAFARAVSSIPGPSRVTVRGDAAWASGTSRTRGEYGGRAINSAGAELMVLVRTPAGWRIAAIHWSSHARRAQE